MSPQQFIFLFFPWSIQELNFQVRGLCTLRSEVLSGVCLFLILLLFTCSVMSDSLWPLDCSTPGFPVLHYLPEFAQTHVHWVSDAIQPSHPLSPSFPALNLSMHQGRFQWVGSSYQVAKVLELQHQSFQWIQGWFPLGLTGLIPLLSKGLSRVFSSTTVWKLQFFSAQPSL